MDAGVERGVDGLSEFLGWEWLSPVEPAGICPRSALTCKT